MFPVEKGHTSFNSYLLIAIQHSADIVDEFLLFVFYVAKNLHYPH